MARTIVMHKAATQKAWSMIIGNEHLKRAIEVALAGKHMITVFGHPDNGEKPLEDILGGRLIFMPPCPCGNLGSRSQICSCTLSKVRRYRETRKFQRALLSDIKTTIDTPHSQQYERAHMAEPFSEVEKRIASMSDFIAKDFKDNTSCQLFKTACDRLNLQIGMALRVKAVSRTIARLDHVPVVKPNHLVEAIQYAMEVAR